MGLGQSAFVKGRSIMDNIHLAQELMRGYSRKRSTPRCAVKIDLKKVYDTIDWDFLNQLLLGLNFHPIFVNWIMQCVSTPMFSISLNGSPHGFFRGKRGLRQGDPMSPSLFILCMEYLSRFINAKSCVNFNFHAKCGRTKITHLAFADDLMLFCRGDHTSLKILYEAMEEFQACSGLETNKQKSNLFVAGVHGHELKQLLCLIFH